MKKPLYALCVETSYARILTLILARKAMLISH